MKKSALTEKVKVLLFLAVIMAITASVPTGSSIITGVSKLADREVIVIDPGHGGFDGGAESALGVCEKDINLAIAMHIREMAEKDGFKVIMTRDSDAALEDTEKGSIRSRKTADLIARKKIIDESGADLSVSIHLNSFKEDRSVKGAQVFYPVGDESDEIITKSKKLAEAVHEKLSQGIDDGTNRPVLAKGDVRIMKNVQSPTIIVECGFLSNAAEAELLSSAKYQQTLAGYIYDGILSYEHPNSLNKTRTTVENIVDSILQNAQKR